MDKCKADILNREHLTAKLSKLSMQQIIGKRQARHQAQPGVLKYYVYLVVF